MILHVSRPYKYSIFYYLYKITNLVNNKIYVGVHQTNNLNDEYFGSGLNLHRAIKKYGKENFFKEILEYFPNETLMFEREKQLVNSAFVESSNTYNIVEGGNGSFSYINSLPNQGHKLGQQKEAAQIAGIKHKNRMLNDPEYKKNHNKKNSESNRMRWATDRSKNINTKGNTMWISNLEISKSFCIPSCLYSDYYDQGWIKGRKFNQYNTDRDLYKKRN